jgi:single-strand DNA-binding protein
MFMAGYNRIIMVGNLTRDPDYKQLSSGQAVCRLGIASNRQFRNKQSGDMVQEVCYMDIDVWGPQADSCNQYLVKGRQILVEGRIKYDTWQDQEGKSRNKHSIVADRVVFLASGSEGSETSTSTSSSANQTMEPRNAVERELMSQLDGIKSRTQAPKAAAPAPAPAVTREAPQPQAATAPRPAPQAVPQAQAPKAPVFKDEPPFQDDLPF